jgi:hypothetical protein
MEADPAEEHVKTVYAHFGLAVFSAQCLEHGLSNALIYLDLIPRRVNTVGTKEQWNAEFDGFLGRNFEQTLARLLARFRELTSVPKDLEELLTTALKRRNWLAHHYFRERAEGFMSASGRESMISEMQEAQLLFELADKCISAVTNPIRERYGITDRRLDDFYAEYVSKIECDI